MPGKDSPLVRHAREEMMRAGLFDADADYGGATASCVMELVETFAKQRHSGGSSAVVLATFDRVVRFRTLSPLTADPSEWNDVSDISGEPMWQNRRDPAAFSKDAGKTWWFVEDGSGERHA